MLRGSLSRWLSPPTARPHRAAAHGKAHRPDVHHGAGHARQGRHVAVPGHGSDVLHRADRLVHRASRRQPARRLQQPLLARRRRSRDSRIPTGSCSSRPGQTTSQVEHILHTVAGLTEEAGRRSSSRRPHMACVSRLTKEKAEQLARPAQVGRAPTPKTSRSRPTNGPCPTTS